MSERRVDLRALLRDPVTRRQLLARALVALQAREGRDLSLGRAYEVVDLITHQRGGGA